MATTTTPTKKPTLIIVHGAWHRPVHFQLIIDQLHTHGYRTVAPALPSVDEAPGTVHADSTADVAAVRAAIVAELDDHGNDVILVPHSYGGIPSSGAIKDLDASSRHAAGKSTSVVAIAAITSFILPKDSDIRTVQPRSESPPSAGVLWDPPPPPFFWHDVPAGSEVYQWAAAALNPMSATALCDRCRFSAFEVVPVHYLLATEDRAIPIALQEKIVLGIRDAGGKVRTEALDGSSHSPFLSRVEETVAFLRRSAGEEV